MIEEIHAALSRLEGEELIAMINEMREAIHQHSPFNAEPVDFVRWVKNDAVYANDYNPNSVAPPEMELLRLSIDADGYTVIPDEAPKVLEDQQWAPSYRRLCKVLLRNDWWCKGLGLTQPKSEAYDRYLKMKKAAAAQASTP